MQQLPQFTDLEHFSDCVQAGIIQAGMEAPLVEKTELGPQNVQGDYSSWKGVPESRELHRENFGYLQGTDSDVKLNMN